MLGFSASGDLVALVDERARRLSWSRAQFVRAIVDYWVAKGCPAVSEADRALLAIHGPSKRKTA